MDVIYCNRISNVYSNSTSVAFLPFLKPFAVTCTTASNLPSTSASTVATIASVIAIFTNYGGFTEKVTKKTYGGEGFR